MVEARPLDDIGRLPTPGDNAAIAARRLEAGLRFVIRDRVHALSHTVLEGHRFAVEPIPTGSPARSWGLPFGTATRDIEPGDYLCNAEILKALAIRNPGFALPAEANFEDYRHPFALQERDFKPGAQVSLHAQPGTFDGYARPGGRGVGTRNDIVILGTTSLTASFARKLEARFKSRAGDYPHIDGITAVTHTEGGTSRRPNNLELVLRTLAGFLVHPNIGAVLAVDYGTETVTNAMLEAYSREHGYPIEHVLHRFYSIERDFAASLDEAAEIIETWLEPVNAMARTSQPLSALKIALQCGGSDAFSGVSGNPLAGWTAKEVIRHGGSAVLAETDELIGAESYILANTRDLDTARSFLDKIAKFKDWISWHGHSSEGNTTGGNKFRGLYNNALKSIGAARKKDPDVCLDYVIDYGQPMTGAGFYFMDSPGNDLESIAGQVAAGCNMVFFITGNGSITNFPFVPTVKFITTTARWNLLAKDMDVNAGRYQDGTPLAELGNETFNYTVDVASGMPSVGERAGHSQVSIWRDWQQTDGSRLHELQRHPEPSGVPIHIEHAGFGDEPTSGVAQFQAIATERGFTTDQVGLIVPTSLCAGQIALKIASSLNSSPGMTGHGVSRFVALPHTEGCGTSSGDNEELYTRTLVGHLVHPLVREALLLEHGCEHTHNDLLRHVLRKRGIDPDGFGYASIQLDGGIEKVVDKVERWFADRLASAAAIERRDVGLAALSLGLLTVGGVSGTTARALAQVAAEVAGAGGTVVVPENATLLESSDFLDEIGLASVPAPTLGYGQTAGKAGLHVMAAPTRHSVETLTGLGGTGVQILLAHVQGPPLQGHPMIPLLQVTTGGRFVDDMDCVIAADERDSVAVGRKILGLVCDTCSRIYTPKLWAAGNTDFQFTRGMLGVSL